MKTVFIVLNSMVIGMYLMILLDRFNQGSSDAVIFSICALVCLVTTLTINIISTK